MIWNFEMKLSIEYYSKLQGYYPNTNILTYRNVVDFLSNEGHIYTTIDDDHFRCTDN
jgi:replication factor A2